MIEVFKWVLLNSDRIGSFGLLLVFAVGETWAFGKGWVVLGTTHRDCLKERDSSRASVTAAAARNEQKVVELERDLEDLRGDLRDRRRSPR